MSHAPAPQLADLGDPHRQRANTGRVDLAGVRGAEDPKPFVWTRSIGHRLSQPSVAGRPTARGGFPSPN
jgi:hypothetical protein